MFDDISLHGIYVTYECGTMAKWRSSLLTKVMGIMQCISECRCVLYLYSSVEARLPWWFYIHACILYMYACRINFCQRYMYRSIESTTLSIPHVRSTHKHYTSTRRSLDLNVKLVACLILRMSAGLSLVYTVITSQQCTL